MLCFLLPITGSLAGGIFQYIVYWTRYWSTDRSEFQFISSYNIHNTVSSTQFVFQQNNMCLYVPQATLSITRGY